MILQLPSENPLDRRRARIGHPPFPAVVEFAGLALGFVGLYQVNARVPEGVEAGSAVPVVITQYGITSNTVTIAVE